MSSRNSSDPPPDVAVWIDGVRVSGENAVVSVFDRGFLYGDSIFETVRTYGGAPFALLEHMQRLQVSADRVFIQMPLSCDALAAEVRAAVTAAALPEAYVRMMVTRGTGALGLDPGPAIDPLRVLIVAPLHPPPLEDYRDGIAAITYQTSRMGDATGAAGAKIGNYLVAVLAGRRAREQGAKEALITGTDGAVVEGATSNFFWFEGGRLCTVPVSAGILPGITRAHILDIARAEGFEVVERVPRVEQLKGAEALFLSSSIREILSVVRLDGVPIRHGRVDDRVRQLHAAFRVRVGAPALPL